jgi:hypothetical protein
MNLLSNIDDCSVIELPKVQDILGNLTYVQKGEFPYFDIKRIYYLYDIPSGSERGGHAHKELYQLIVAASGSFDVILNDGHLKEMIKLDKPNYGLFIVPGIWRELINFSSGAVCLVLASEKYDEDDYIRNISEFICYKGIKD